MKALTVIFLFFTTSVSSKELTINRCTLSNGTVTFQEQKCNSDFIKNKEAQSRLQRINQQKKMGNNKSQKISQIKKTVKIPRKTKDSSLISAHLPQVNTNKSLIKNISNTVKAHRISIDVLNHWNIVNKVFNNKLLHMNFSDDTSPSNMSLMIDYIYTDNKVFSDSELTEIVYLVGSRFVDGSRENQVNPYNLKVNKGKGVAATFTDSDQENRYKYAQKGAIYKQGWLIQFTLLSNNIFSTSHQFALQSLANSILINKI